MPGLVEEEVSRPKIPQSDSIQELSAFWDAHDLTEFEDQLEVAGGIAFERQVTPPPSPGVHMTAQIERRAIGLGDL